MLLEFHEKKDIWSYLDYNLELLKNVLGNLDQIF